MRRILIVSIAALLLVFLLIWSVIDNKALELNTITVNDDGLPDAFDGFRIAHISDLHSAEMGQGNEKLLLMIRNANPDVIAITGDLVDHRDTDLTVALSFCKEAAKIAPVYYVTGNHEARLNLELYEQLISGLTDAGVNVLEDREVFLSRETSAISFVGHCWGDTENIGLISQFNGYRILLSHQPEDIDNYAAAGYDLVLCGHAHGGQFRITFVGGLVAPGQGLFPQYDSGLYCVKDTYMVVSRGIGNSTIPLRFNNPPEVILIILQS